MKKLNLNLIFLFIFVLTANIYSQNAWVQQNSGTDKSIRTCYFINSLTGFTGGSGGLILRTTNGGVNWDASYEDDIYYFTSLFFINDNTGWALGSIQYHNDIDTNILIKTTDCGQSWIKNIIDSCTSLFYDDIYFINTLTGYITGCNLKKTTDGGTSWNVDYDSNTTGIYFLNELTGWMGGRYLGVSKTTNGGLNWFMQHFPFPHHYDTEIYFFNELTGFYIHHWGGTLFATTNSGTNWAGVYYPYFLSSIFFADQHTGYMLAFDGSNKKYIAKTTDKGSNWTFLNIESKWSFSQLFFTSANTGWIVGDSGLILKTLNGGVIPDEIMLYQNYPNPFNSSTIIKFNIPLMNGDENKESFVSIDIFDALGRKVTTLCNENYRAGTYEIRWTTLSYNLPSGIYFSRLRVQQEGTVYSKTNKMVLLK